MSAYPTESNVVVGVDGSPESNHALAWAVARAERLGHVQPVTAWQYPWWAFVPAGTGTVMPPTDEQMADMANRVIEHSLVGIDRSDLLEPVVVHGIAGSVLVSVSEGADLLVIGSRGRGAVAAGLLGSVSSLCAKKATVPVAVVPSDVPIEDRFNKVVVGHDGSAAADKALEWAARHTADDADIVVVNAWDPSSAITAQVAALSLEQLQAESEATAQKAISQLLSQPDFAQRNVTAVSESGDPRQVLRTHARRCDMLIIGHRGHGGLSHLLLGSVATALVHHPVTATVIVR